MAKKIYVGKLPSTIVDQRLTDLFSTIGKVISVRVIKNSGSAENLNHGYIQMSTEEETQRAIRTLNNTVVEGSRILVVEGHFLDQERSANYHSKWKKRTFKR